MAFTIYCLIVKYNIKQIKQSLFWVLPLETGRDRQKLCFWLTGELRNILNMITKYKYIELAVIMDLAIIPSLPFLLFLESSNWFSH